MYVLQVWVQYQQRFAEIVSEDEGSAWPVIEDLAALALSERAESIWIEDVKLRFFPPKATGERICIIDVFLQLPERTALLSEGDIQELEFAAEGGMGCGLMELFDGIYGISIEQVLLRYHPRKQRSILTPIGVE